MFLKSLKATNAPARVICSHTGESRGSALVAYAARKAGLAIEQSVAKAQETEPFVGLTAIKEEKLPITKSEALMNQ
jgi:hypothetical protein